MPITSCGLRLDDEVVRVCVGLAAGSEPVCALYKCTLNNNNNNNKIMFKGTRSLSNAICNTHNIFLPEYKYNWMTEKLRVT